MEGTVCLSWENVEATLRQALGKWPPDKRPARPVRRRFDGPLLPGPDWNQPLEAFDPEHLRRCCQQSPRVADFLARHDQGDQTLASRLAAVEERVQQLTEATEERIRTRSVEIGGYE